MEKPGEPYAFPSPLPADPVHSVVPVAVADERQAVRSGGEAVGQRAPAVLQQRRLVEVRGTSGPSRGGYTFDLTGGGRD